MKTIFKILLIIFLIQNICNAQGGKPVKLLGDWFGEWKGILEINNSNGNKNIIEMELKISETDTAGVWLWEISYGEGEKKEVRKYLLRKVDSEKGQYELDERNSILLDFYCEDYKSFYSSFKIDGNIINSEYHLTEGEIKYRLISSSEKLVNINTENGNGSKIMYSYPVEVIQQATLIKK